MAESGSDTRSGIGARLRAGRDKTGLTLLQVAEKLHVDAKVVESLESERFDLLGAPVFVRGHLKHYAELIGEQPAQLLELYTGATKPAMPDLTRLPKVAPQGRPSRLAVPALVVLIGFVLLGVVWWLVQSIGGSSETPPKPTAQTMTIEPEAVANSQPLDDPGIAAEGNANDTAAAASGRPNVGATPSAGASGNTSASSSAGTSGRTTPPASSASPRASGPAARAAASGTAVGQATPAALAGASALGATAAAAPPAAGTATPVRGKPMEVTLKFAADSWVEVYDASGEKLFYDIGSADSSRTISGTPPFRVTFGNAPGVTLDVNGKPATVPASAVKDDAAQFVINRSGRIVRAPPQADGG
jgi:cytoskeleton protein RodZ